MGAKALKDEGKAFLKANPGFAKDLTQQPQSADRDEDGTRITGAQVL